MPHPDPTDARIRASFARQGMMRTLGAQVLSVTRGRCVISAPLSEQVSQQHGAGHAALAFALGDSAAGYAALTVMPGDSEVMTAEIKINLLRPAVGTRLEAVGTVLKPGRRLVVVQAEVTAMSDTDRRLCAVLMGTMVPVSA